MAMARLLSFLLFLPAVACAHRGPCPDLPAVQVLGSGGPIPDDKRASAGYLVWSQSGARVLVDAGGGTFQRFGEAEAELNTLDVIALTHLHTDHSADLPALLKGTFFSDRSQDLVVSGPAGAGAFPGVTSFVQGLFGAEVGVYRYLSWLLDPTMGGFSLDLHEVDPATRTAVQVLSSASVKLEAVGVEHGPVPALAYRVEVEGYAVVFSGDQNGNNPHFADFVRGADVLVMHHPVPERTNAVAASLHARPSEIAEVAARAKVPHLVLSHHMARSLAGLDEGMAAIRKRYDGRVTVAEDLMCVGLE